MTLRDWLAARVPPVPGDFGAWMEPAQPEAAASPEAILAETELSLERSLAPEGRPRGGAFDLLAADGFLTYACEAALEADDPEAALQSLLHSVSRSEP